MSEASSLRQQVERLIIENRNPLNDPNTNEPYDVKGIANDVIELIQSREAQAELKGRINELEELPWKRDDKYGVNSPYITKAWLVARKAELKAMKGDK